MNNNKKEKGSKQEKQQEYDAPIFNLSFKNTTLTKKETLKLMNNAVIPLTHNTDF